MKILYITDQMYLHGGGERVLTNKSNYLIDNNIEVYVVTSEQKKNPPCYPIDSKVIFEDLEINYQRDISYFSPSNFVKIPKHYFRLKKAIRKIKPDIIVTLSTQFDFYFLPFIFKKTPKIKEFHSSRYYQDVARRNNTSFLRKIVYKINDFVESKYDYLAILTKDEKQYYPSDNTIIIPNGLTRYPSSVSELSRKRAISAGRIAPVKQFDKLITSWSYVIEECPDWELEIYGEGTTEDIDILQKLIETYKLQDQVKLCGRTDVIEEKMINSSLYVMSSQTECFPMVLLEAMSCGLPVISFDCPHGPKNIITNHTDGILVEQDNEKELAKAIVRIIKDKSDLIDKSKAARKSAERFLPKNVMEQWMDVFNQSKTCKNV